MQRWTVFVLYQWPGTETTARTRVRLVPEAAAVGVGAAAGATGAYLKKKKPRQSCPLAAWISDGFQFQLSGLLGLIPVEARA